jgi:hypothetical protein
MNVSMNAFVAALYDEEGFCKSGCGACINALRRNIRHHAGSDQPAEWEIIASLQPSELIPAPAWEQRLRHLLGVREMRGGRTQLDPYLNQIIEQWLATSQYSVVDYKHLLFIDFLLWDICHKLHAVCHVDNDLYSRVVRQATDIAVKATTLYFGFVEFDSLIESLQIIHNTDGIIHEGLKGLLEMPWPIDSRTGHILSTLSVQ